MKGGQASEWDWYPIKEINMTSTAGRFASKRKRPYERFSDIQIDPGLFFAVRADGHNFHALTKGMNKPYDKPFRNLLNQVVQEYFLHHLTEPFFAFAFSDEINLFFRQEDARFHRRIEKLDSMIASALSVILAKKVSSLAFFDARVVVLPRLEDVMHYLEERQAEAARDCINGYTFYTMVRAGLSPEKAGEAMKEWKFERMNKYLREHKVIFNGLPPWQKRGQAFYWESYRKPGYNPLADKRTRAKRFRIVKNDRLPRFETVTSKRLVQKALEARTYLPSKVTWKEPMVKLTAGWEVG
jgi:tRNA(His) 5'-end guanylyltransferase